MLGPLRRPDRYFERHAPGLRLGRAVAVALLVALVATATLGVFGYALAEQAGEATVTVDNENRPPDWVCERHGDDPDSPLGTDCDEPSEREVRASSLVWNAVVDRLPVVFFTSLTGWVLGGVGMHVLTALAGGEGSFGDSLAVAGWAQATTLPQFVLLGAVFVTFAGSVDVTAGEAALESQVAGFRSDLRHPVVLLGAALTTAWQGWVYYHGMSHARNVDRDAAALIAVCCGVLAFVGSVL
ncbi:Yip1 family protein [Halomarina ordinaria]|uniref:Yip1 family protein n=1 Tax=Halomarina ordinaria TaxID=3033939 RepID=A0ABD5U7W1_9EURY|nr:Yip1 family protein [Halomarina sp. PSRA2]